MSDSSSGGNSKKKTSEPWDRVRPYSKKVDERPEGIYEAVGRALSAWEGMEGMLSILFAFIVSGDTDAFAARRAYNAVRTFEGRLGMLRAAFSAYCHDYPQNKELNKLRSSFNNTIRLATGFSGRRNEIAHGVVSQMMKGQIIGEVEIENDGYALLPSYANTGHRNLDETPEYYFTSDNINIYSEMFGKISPDVVEVWYLVVNLSGKHRASALLGTRLPPRSP